LILLATGPAPILARTALPFDGFKALIRAPSNKHAGLFRCSAVGKGHRRHLCVPSVVPRSSVAERHFDPQQLREVFSRRDASSSLAHYSPSQNLTARANCWQKFVSTCLRPRQHANSRCECGPVFFRSGGGAGDLRGFRLFIFNALLVHTVAADWINPARAPRSSRHLERYSLASDLANLCVLLQQNQDPPVTGQRCPSRSPCSVDRKYRITRNPRRASSPLCSGLGFRYTHGTRTHDLGFCNAKVDASEGPK
jgi:hypothetical protein